MTEEKKIKETYKADENIGREKLATANMFIEAKQRATNMKADEAQQLFDELSAKDAAEGNKNEFEGEPAVRFPNPPKQGVEPSPSPGSISRPPTL